MEHVAEGQENNRETPQGCSRGGDGVIKNITISELGDQPSHLHVKSCLPLTWASYVIGCTRSSQTLGDHRLTTAGSSRYL